MDVNTVSTPAPYDWLKQVPHAVMELDSVPLMGYAPIFPLEVLQSELSKVFNLKGLNIELDAPVWRSPAELYTHFPQNSVKINMAVSPLNGMVTWLIAEHDIDVLMELLLSIKDASVQTIDPNFKAGFERFLIFEVIHILGKLNFDKGLSYNYIESIEPSTSEEPSLCFEVKLTVNESAIACRLILSPDFYQSWKQRYAEKKTDVISNPALAEKLGIVLHLEAGKTSFTLSDWRSLRPGDFFILDHCSFEPEEDKGRIMITVGGHPYFRAKLKQGNIKILEFPLYHEVHAPMNTPDDDEDFNHDEESEFDDDDFGDFTLGDEDELDEDFDYEGDIEEDEDHEEHHEEEEEAPAKEQPTQHKPPEAKTVQKVEELSVHVTIEVGRIEMTVQKFLELQPGNMLELDVKPENGIDIVVNGKCLGKGELLRIGESLGVRVLEIG